MLSVHVLMFQEISDCLFDSIPDRNHINNYKKKSKLLRKALKNCEAGIKRSYLCGEHCLKGTTVSEICDGRYRYSMTNFDTRVECFLTNYLKVKFKLGKGISLWTVEERCADSASDHITKLIKTFIISSCTRRVMEHAPCHDMPYLYNVMPYHTLIMSCHAMLNPTMPYHTPTMPCHTPTMTCQSISLPGHAIPLPCHTPTMPNPYHAMP